jgi:hypothetical protein
MNSQLRKIIIFVIMAGIGFLLFTVVKAYGKKQQYVENSQSVPDLELFGIRSFDAMPAYRKGTIIMYYNPECDYCVSEMNGFEVNQEKYQDLNLVFISSSSKGLDTTFLSNYSFYELPGRYFGYDANDLFYEKFGSRLVPATFCYDEKNQLMKAFKGEVSAELIIKYMEDEL